MKYLFLFLAFFTSPLFGQSVFEKQSEYADRLFEQKLYFDAITEYKRLEFFDTSGTFQFNANFKIASAYLAGAKLDAAVKYFVKADLFAENEEDRTLARFELVRVNILRRTIPTALRLLNTLEKEDSAQKLKNDINYWRGWAYIFGDDWETASKSFALVDTAQFLKMFADSVENEKYSVIFAKVISMIVPGAGQVYTGNYLSGALSLAWNLLSGYYTVNSFVEERVFDGLLIGNLVWLRFYRGNYMNAEKFAVRKNLEITNRALTYLQKKYKGIKP